MTVRVIQFMIGSFGGAERFFVRLNAALAGKGVKQLAYVNEHPDLVEDLRSNNVEHLTFRPSPSHLLDKWRLHKLSKAFSADIIVAWMNRASRRLPHGRHVNVGRLGGYYSARNYKKCDHLIANTPGIKEFLVSDGWHQSRVSTISNFTDDFYLGARPNHLRTDRRFTICALGRFDPWKGFDTLLLSIKDLDNVVLLLAGKGPEEEKLRRMTAELQIEDRVTFLGWCNDRGDLFRKSDLCVVPSLHEPLGNVILEAWSARCPVIAASSEGPRWLIEHNYTGLLVKPNDPQELNLTLSSAMLQPELMITCAMAGRKKWEDNFSVDAVTSQYVQLFDYLLAQTSLPPEK